MKINKDDKYFKISFCVFATLFSLYIACALVIYIPVGIHDAISLICYVFDLLTPVIIGFIIAYLLLIPTRVIETFLLSRKHVKIKNKTVCRAIGVIVSYLTVIAIIVATIIGIYYMIGGQLSKSTTFNHIYKTVKQYFDGDTISADSLQQQLSKLNLPFSDVFSSKLDTIATYLSSFIGNVASILFGSVISIGGNLFNFLISIILSIYFIMSYEYYTKFMNKVFYVIFRNSKIGKSIRTVISIVNDTFSAYIRGQLIEAFIVAVLSTIVLYILGIDYAPVIGIISGITNLIPYVGPLVGTVLAGIIAFLGGDFFSLLWAVIGMQAVQQVDANIICPRVVGNIVGLPAAFVIIAILVGGSYAGLIGMLLAVPVAASLKILIGMWFDHHFSSFENDYEVIKKEQDYKKHEQRRLILEKKQQRKNDFKIRIHKLLKKLNKIKNMKKD